MGDKLDKLIEQSYYRQGAGVQINIMDIGRLFKDVREAVSKGQEINGAVAAAIVRYAVKA